MNRDDFNRRFDAMARRHRRFDIFHGFFMVIFAIVFLAMLGLMGWATVTCLSSGDKNSMACWLLQDRVEVGVREAR